MKVSIRVPVQDLVDKDTARWLLWACTASTPEIEVEVGLHDSAGWGVANARNDVVRDFLKGDATHLWMVDSDTEPPRSLRLLEGANDYRVLSGAYPGVTKSGFRWHLYKQVAPTTWAPMHPKFVPKDRYFKVDAAGLGCCVIQRSVLEEFGPDPFEFRRDADGEWIGEDMLFGLKVGGVWVDTEYVCEHHRRAALIHCWRKAKDEYSGRA